MMDVMLTSTKDLNIELEELRQQIDFLFMYLIFFKDGYYFYKQNNSWKCSCI